MAQSGKLRTGLRERNGIEQQRRILQIARRLSATLGSDFFRSLVKNLTEVLAVDAAWLAELVSGYPDHLRTLAVVHDGAPAPDFDETLSGTASAQVMSDGVLARSRNVREIFPTDSRLAEIPAESYAGIRLCDATGQPLGVLAVAGRQPLPDPQLVLSVLAAFGPRTACEIARKRDTDMHRESEERHQAFITGNPDGMWRLEFDPPVSVEQPEDRVIEQLYLFGYVAECNDACARFFGRERAADLLGSPLELIAPRDDVRLQQDLRAAIRSRFRSTITERVLSGDDGRPCYRLRTDFGIVEHGSLRRLWGSTRDITGLRRAELAAAAAERRFRQVLEGIRLPAVMLNRSGVITFWNASFGHLTNCSAAELSTMTWLGDLVSATEAEIWKGAMVSAPGSEPAFHFEGEVIQQDRASRQVQWDTICLRDPDDRVSALAAIGRDLTHERALEAQLRRTQTLDGIARLAAGLAHDFNNLLTIVVGHASELLRQVTETDRAYGSLLEIVDAATLCTKLTHQLLAFGRKQPLKPQLIDIGEVVADSERLVRTILGLGIELVIRRAPVPFVLADPIQIQQVLANLATNARDAMPHGGTLTIASTAVEIAADDAEHAGVQPGVYVQIEVSDTGEGVSDEILTRIFEPFVTTKDPGKGTGLGLSTVYGIVRQTGGQVTVRSERGKGTTFEILLPTTPPVVH